MGLSDRKIFPQTTYAWRQAWKDHIEHFVPAQAKNHEDQRMEWIKAQNTTAGQIIIIFIQHEFVKDESEYTCELIVGANFILQ